MVDELEPPKVKKKRGRKPGMIYVGESKISYKNLWTSDGIYYDSPLTHLGKPRKIKRRVLRTRHSNYYGVPMSKKDYQRHKQECIVKLLSFCPRYSMIYTNITGEREDATYIDVMVCHNNRIYRITKLVAIIVDKQIAKTKSRQQFDKITTKPPLDECGRTNPKRNNLRYAEEIVKSLSKNVFNVDDAYIWQDISQIFCFNAEFKPKLKPHQIPRNKKEEIDVDTPQETVVESTPRKTYRVR